MIILLKAISHLSNYEACFKDYQSHETDVKKQHKSQLKLLCDTKKEIPQFLEPLSLSLLGS